MMCPACSDTRENAWPLKCSFYTDMDEASLLSIGSG